MSAVITEGNWIGYRASVVRAMTRADTDDETLEICGYCECEVDIDEPIHRPGCRGIGAPRASSATVVSLPAEQKSTTPAKKLPAPRVEPEGLDLLERMDAGIPVTDEDEPEHVDEDEEPMLEEAAAVGQLAGSGAAASAESGEPERAATSSSTSAKTRRQRATPASDRWPREAIIAAIQAYANEHGHTPSQHDWQGKSDTCPNAALVKRVFGGWGEAIVAAGYPRPKRGATNYIDGHRPSARSGRDPEAGAARRPSRPAPASASPSGDGRTSSRPDTAGWIKVNGTGLAYRNPDEAYIAAVEIEADGERVAAACREDGNDERADQAIDQAHELAEKIRTAARAAEERASRSSTSSEAPKPEVEPEPEPEEELPPAAVATPLLPGGASRTSSPLIRLLAKLPAKDLDEAILEIQHELRSLEVQLAIVDEARDAQEAA